ncbi:MAG: hypothetical protein ACFC03_01920 [Candidatus Malihini olakiniferum]
MKADKNVNTILPILASITPFEPHLRHCFSYLKQLTQIDSSAADASGCYFQALIHKEITKNSEVLLSGGDAFVSVIHNLPCILFTRKHRNALLIILA